MSTLTVTNIQATGETASRSVSGVAAAWGFVIGSGTAAIQDSNNFSSITDNGPGNYTIAYTNSMGNTNYAYQLTVGQLRGSSASTNARVHGYPVIATGSITFITSYITGLDGSSTAADTADINLVMHGDLA